MRGSASVTPVGDLLVQLGWLTPPDHPAAAAATVCSHQHLQQQSSATTTAAVSEEQRLADWKAVAMTRQKTTATKLATSLIQPGVVSTIAQSLLSGNL